MQNNDTMILRNWGLGIACAGLLSWLIYQLSAILTPFISAAIIAYILNPMVLKLCAFKYKNVTFNRTFSSSFVLIFLILVTVGIFLIVVPVIKSEASLLQSRLPSIVEQLNTGLVPWLKTHFDIQLNFDTNTLKQWLSGLSAGDEFINNALNAFKNGGAAILGFVGNLALTIVLTFYFLIDWPSLVKRLYILVPKRMESQLHELLNESDGVLGQYLRGQLAVMLVLSIYYSIALWFAGFDVALPVGIITGLLVVVPYLGYALGLVLALIAALLQFDGVSGLIAVAVIYGFGQLVESFYLTPRLVGASLGLHPAAVIFALLAFGQLLGFVGVLLALPLAALVVVVGKRLFQKYLNSSWYKHRN